MIYLTDSALRAHHGYRMAARWLEHDEKRLVANKCTEIMHARGPVGAIAAFGFTDISANARISRALDSF
jgi:hypothetical protein